MIRFVVFTFIILVSLGSKECKNKPMHEFKTLCIIDTDEFICWRSKEKNEGFSFSEMNNWYALSNEEFEIILDTLLECKFNRKD